MASLIPPTCITLEKPLPTTASTSMVDGKFRLEIEVDLAAAVGRAALNGEDPGAIVVSVLGPTIATATKELFVAVAAARQLAKGSA